MSDENESLKSNALRYVVRQPFHYVLLLAILASVVALAYYDRDRRYIEDVLTVGKWSVITVGVSIILGWLASFAPGIKATFDSIPMMTSNYERLSLSHESNSESMRTIARFVASLQQSLRNNRMLLVIEDSRMHEEIIRIWSTEIVAEFDLDLHVARSLTEGLDNLALACVAVVDVILPDNDCANRINDLITMAGCPVIIYSAATFQSNEFPGAASVLTKDCGEAAFKDAIRDAIRRRIRRFA